MEFTIILILIILNGLLSMAEIAIVSVKRSRLKALKDAGSQNASLILDLTENPNRFFSTVQVGISLVGVLTGAFGGVTFSAPLSRLLQQQGIAAQTADSIAFACIVIALTYLTLVIGELVPKRLGLNFSEKLALFMAHPMHMLSRIFGPIVSVLSRSTDFVLRMMQIKMKKHLPVSEEEVRLLIQEGAQTGIFETAEKNIVEKVLNIGDAKVNTLMKARNKVIWLDSNTPYKQMKDIILTHQYSYFPVSEGELDNVVGILRTDTFLAQSIMDSDEVNIPELLHKPLLIPENKKVLETLELFKRSRIHLGIIIDEYGNVQGIITLTDILEAIVGDIPDINEQEERGITKRSAISWFVDGLVSTAEFKEFFKIDVLPNEADEDFNTIGGFVMNQLGRVPVSGDKITLDALELEVVDMDGNRVDKLLVNRKRV